MKTVPHIEIVLPIFNEVDNILPLLGELDAIAKTMTQRARISYLFVDDGSSDGSKELLKKLYKQRDDIRIVEFVHNFGHGAAITAGLTHFQGDIAVLMDADFQDSPGALPKMLTAWEEGATTVVAERGSRKEKTRLFFQAFYYLLHRTTRNIEPIKFGTHCLLDKAVVKRVVALKERNRYFPGLVSFASEKITPIRIDRGARANGSSRVGALGLIKLAVTALVSFSSFPVHLVSLVGLMASLGAISGGLLILFIKIFTDKAIPGWASQMTATAFSSGIQLLCIGIIGEYVARIYDEVKNRPLFLVQNVFEKTTKKRQQAA